VTLSVAQLARMSRLLDAALPLDEAGRRRWLEALDPADEDLQDALRQALLPEADADVLDTLPKVGCASTQVGSRVQAGVLIGPYRLVRRLGAGGMAEVWLAQRADGAFKREVALKLPMLASAREDLAGRFERERDILASLEHPNIARLYDAGVSADGLPYLAMEYVSGRPLIGWCDVHQLEVRERLKLFEQVLDAVQYAHGCQVIHRDIKPSNILVTEAGQVRLLDFGVAKLLVEEPERADLTRQYGQALTPEYASPELIHGGRIGAAADVYSLGVVLYELLAGTRPYRLSAAGSIDVLEQAIAGAQVQRPSTQVAPQAGDARGTTQHRLARRLKGDLDAIVLKALAKSPADRYSSAAALADDLRRYLNGKPVQARPAHLGYRFGKFVQRHRSGAAISAAAFVLAATALGYEQARWPGARFEYPVTGGLEAKSIAVLPFVDMSEKRDQEYFSDGLSEELIDRLARSADLKVIARTSSFQFKGRNEDVRSIAVKLGVANLLEGSVRKAGDTLRITAQLIRASDGTHVWSQTYDRNLVDIFQVQDEIAGTVAQALNAALATGDRPGRQHPDVQAYNLVLEGNYFNARWTRRDVGRAIQLFQQAIQIKPDYAMAWARLAGAYFNLEALQGTASADDNRKILEALERAIRLDPNLVWAYYTRGGFEMTVSWDWAAGQADVERMRAIDPRNGLLPRALGGVALTFGQVDRAVEFYQRALERDPLDTYSIAYLGDALCAANRAEECLQTRLKLLQLHPEFGGVNSAVGIARLYLGQFAEALESMNMEPEENYRLAGLAMVYSAMGRRAESDAALLSLEEKFARTDAYAIAQVHAYRGGIDAAFSWLDRAYRQRDAAMASIKADPLLRNLHDDGRFQKLLNQLRLPDGNSFLTEERRVSS
jgi:serine/threonine protein kinase/TolB-like protein/Tfp pilus assembly protein PilF